MDQVVSDPARQQHITSEDAVVVAHHGVGGPVERQTLRCRTTHWCQCTCRKVLLLSTCRLRLRHPLRACPQAAECRYVEERANLPER